MENKSLSARIKRRNKCGFIEEGSHTYGLTPSGHYTDLSLNYKTFDRNEEQINLVNRTKNYKQANPFNKNISKHVGSKPINKLRHYWK